MKLSDMYPSRFLKAEDFEEGKTFILTVKDVQIETLGQGAKQETKPVMYFRDTEKVLALNKTNAITIGKHLGDDTDEWIGKKIAFTTTEVEMKGEIVRAIRVKTKQAVGPTPPPVPVTDNEDEPPDLPFGLPEMNVGKGVKVPSKQTVTA